MLTAERRKSIELQKTVVQLESENSTILAKLRVAQNNFKQKQKEVDQLLASIESQINEALKSLDGPQVQNASSPIKN